MKSSSSVLTVVVNTVLKPFPAAPDLMGEYAQMMHWVLIGFTVLPGGIFTPLVLFRWFGLTDKLFDIVVLGLTWVMLMLVAFKIRDIDIAITFVSWLIMTVLAVALVLNIVFSLG
jgi:hypothetical protein